MSSTRRSRRSVRAPIARSLPRQMYSSAKCTWIGRARLGVDPGVPVEESGSERLRAVLNAAAKKLAGASLQSAAMPSASPAAPRKAGTSRPGRKSSAARGRLPSRTRDHGLRMRSDRQPGRPPEPGRRVGRQGPWRRAFRSDRVRRWQINSTGSWRSIGCRASMSPPIEVVLLDRKDLPSSGAGETPIVGVRTRDRSAARAFGPVATELPVKLV